MYRLFDLCLDSELSLPGLPACAERSPDWSITVLDEAALGQDFERYHSWKEPNKREIMSAARRGSAYALEFVGLARFLIDFEARRVGVRPEAGCADSTIAHLLQDQVFPRAVCHLGRLVLHASAVGMADGGAIAFTGASGSGKSTLASAFFRAGYRLLSDDCLLLDCCEGEVFAVPPYSSVRLWPDSADALLAGDRVAGLRSSPMAHYSDKKVFSPAEQPARTARSRLHTLFLLGPPGPLDIEPVRGMDTIMALLEAQFALDMVSEESVRRAFSAVRRIAEPIRVLRLTYPRDYGVLSEVMEAVAEAAGLHAATQTGQA